jgi:hypothetical protein
LAIGSIDDIPNSIQVGSAAWESGDGIRWTRVETGVDADFFLRDLASGPKGVALIGNRYSETDAATEVWYSADAKEWVRTYSVPITDDVPAVLVDIGAGRDGFVATGYLGAGSSPEPFVVASGDGLNWVEAPAQPAVEEMGTGGQVAAMSGDWLIAGKGEGQIPVWRSADGLAWERVATIDTSAVESGIVSAEELLEVGGGVLISVVGCCTTLPAPVGVWASPDGFVWDSAPFPTDAVLRGTAATSLTSIVVGNLGAREARAAMWALLRS